MTMMITADCAYSVSDTVFSALCTLVKSYELMLLSLYHR